MIVYKLYSDECRLYLSRGESDFSEFKNNVKIDRNIYRTL